jgi:hypothetical protein
MPELRAHNQQRLIRTGVTVEMRMIEETEFRPDSADLPNTRQPRMLAGEKKHYPGETVPRTPKNGLPVKVYKYRGTGKSDPDLDEEWRARW